MSTARTAECILIVDDDFDIRETIRDILLLRGYTVGAASDGKEALQLLRRGPPPCVILLDLMMPGMNGWEFREEQVRDPELAKIPVVVLSGDGSVDQKAGAIAAAAFLRKPLELSVLLATVSRYCKGSSHPH
jgi:CheY-like chemotaxis protein